MVLVAFGLFTATPVAVPTTATVVAPTTKFVPVIVTVPDPPCTAEDGVRLAIVGAMLLTVNVAAELVPPAVVTVTVCPPAVAFDAIVNGTLIDVTLLTVTVPTVMPVPPTFTEIGRAHV